MGASAYDVRNGPGYRPRVITKAVGDRGGVGTMGRPGPYPAVYYPTLRGCSSDDVPYSHLATDLAHSQLPAFSFITPNLIDDMHLLIS